MLISLLWFFNNVGAINFIEEYRKWTITNWAKLFNLNRKSRKSGQYRGPRQKSVLTVFHIVICSWHQTCLAMFPWSLLIQNKSIFCFKYGKRTKIIFTNAIYFLEKWITFLVMVYDYLWHPLEIWRRVETDFFFL